MRIDGQLTTCGVHTPQEAWEFIPGLDLVVYERFASSKATSHDALYTIEVVGGIQALCWYLKIPMVRHEPQNRVAFLDEAHDFVEASRKARGELMGKYAIHEIDALAHLLSHEHFGDKLVHRRWGKGISDA